LFDIDPVFNRDVKFQSYATVAQGVRRNSHLADPLNALGLQPAKIVPYLVVP
jgi:hypothetical protein